MMQDWHPDKKGRFRYEVLRTLSVIHGQQKSRMSDTALCLSLRDQAWDVDLNDVVTILQDMHGRGWVSYRQIKNVFARRVQLLEIEILPDGQDVFDQVVASPAVRF
jgi:hypothetical protein